MLSRCSNPKNNSWPRYGGRGVKVCARWKSFENFYADMGPCPGRLTIERLDSKGNYEPQNCVWADRFAQARNRSLCVKLTARGVTKTLTEWATEVGRDRLVIKDRIAKGWSVEDAIFVDGNASFRSHPEHTRLVAHKRQKHWDASRYARDTNGRFAST